MRRLYVLVGDQHDLQTEMSAIRTEVMAHLSTLPVEDQKELLKELDSLEETDHNLTRTTVDVYKMLSYKMDRKGEPPCQKNSKKANQN